MRPFLYSFYDHLLSVQWRASLSHEVVRNVCLFTTEAPVPAHHSRHKVSAQEYFKETRKGEKEGEKERWGK